MDAPLTANEIRSRMRQELPADTFARRPFRALRMLPPLAAIVAGMAVLVAWEPAWPISLVISLGMAQSFAILGFVAHEALHGALVQRRWLQDALGHLGLGPFLVSPQLWRFWHNQVHHGQTNRGNRDPDSFGTLGRYERMPSTRFVARLAPGSGRWYSAFFMFYWFSFHGQVVLWLQSRFMTGFRSYDSRPAKLHSALYLASWIALGVAMGPRASLFAIALPMLGANFIVMSYIATNHFMRPQTTSNEPLENSMSVTTWGWIDRLHLNFSHHVEHHLFPTLSARHAPRLRAWLERNVGTRYVSPRHLRAFLALYRTPRVYLDAHTLVNPDRPERRVDLADVTRMLEAG